MNKLYLPNDDRNVIHCDICRRALKTYVVHRDEWDSDDRCYYDVKDYVTDEGVIRKNWVCFDCDRNMPKIVKKRIERSGKEYIKGLKERLDDLEREYNKKVYDERRRTSLVEILTKRVESVEKLSDLDEKAISNLLEMKGKPFNCYYLEMAIEKERKEAQEKLEGPRKIFKEWAKEYGFNLSLDGRKKEFWMLSLKEFYAMTEDSRWFDIKFSEWSEKRDKIEKDLRLISSRKGN